LVRALAEAKPVLNRYRVAQPSIQLQSDLKPIELQSGSISNCCRSSLQDSADNTAQVSASSTEVAASSVEAITPADSLQPSEQDSKKNWRKISCF